MSIASQPANVQLQNLQGQINEQQEALDAYVSLAGKASQAAAVVPLIFTATVRELIFLKFIEVDKTRSLDCTQDIDQAYI